MSRFKIALIILTALLGSPGDMASAAVAQSGQYRWEQVGDLSGLPVRLAPVKGVKGVNSGVGNSHLYLEVSDPTRIELFTILGQPIITAELKPGLHRIRLSSRGIYLLRIGNATIRIKY